MVEFVRKPLKEKPPSLQQLFWREAFPDRLEVPAILLLLMITLAGMIFRLANLLRPVGFDEAYTYLAFSSQPFIRILTDYTYPNNHIFHSLLVALTTRIIPVDSSWVMRLPAFIAGVLMILAAFLAGRSLYHTHAGLIAATLVAASTPFISFSTDARGYTLLCLMSLIMLWMAGSVAKNPHPSGYLVLTVAGILGAFTIPIMLYPLAAIYVWMVVDSQLTREADRSIRRPLLPIFLSAGFVLLGTLLVYAPVIVMGTGIKSLMANGFVSPLGWDEFILDMQSRLNSTWMEWTQGEHQLVIWGIFAGFGLSLFFQRRHTQSRVHLAITTILTIAVILSLQQVAPQPRIWLFLLSWLYLCVGAGWAGILSFLPQNTKTVIAILLITLAAGSVIFFRGRQVMTDDIPVASSPGVEESVAIILSDQLNENEQIVVVLPSGTQIKYYYDQKHGQLTDFYYTSQPETDIPESFLVVVNKKYDETLESVLAKNKLTTRVNIPDVHQVTTYKQVDLYRIPTLNQP